MVRDLLTFRPSSKNWEKLRLILWVNEISETQEQESATRKFDNQRKLLQENQTYYSTSEIIDDLFEIFFSNFNRLNEYAKMPKSCCLLLTVFVRVTSEVQRNADFFGFLRFISTTISLEN